MLRKEQIQNAIFDGLTNACNDAYHFTGHISAKISPEYIVTVNVAKSILKIDEGQFGYGYGFILKFEEKTFKFASACVEQIIADDIFNMRIRDDHNTNRKGKIDICLYDSFGTKAFCPIEVKGFTPSKREIYKDLERNVELLKIIDHNTGNSILNFTFLALLTEHRNCIKEENIERGVASIQNKYQILIQPFIEKHLDLTFTVLSKTVSKNLIGEKRKIDEDDFPELYHFVGVLIVVEKSSK